MPHECIPPPAALWSHDRNGDVAVVPVPLYPHRATLIRPRPERGAARPASQDPDHRQSRHLLSCERGTEMARWRYLLRYEAGMSGPLDPRLVASARLEAAVRGAGSCWRVVNGVVNGALISTL